MSDAFITSLDQSTKCFRPGLTVRERIPPVDQYLNLLKCVFLLKKMKASHELKNASPQSHWPSYVKELEEVCHLDPVVVSALTTHRGSPTNAASSPAAW